ncbi:MAG: DUF4864 domain-containing protein [Brevirhabdus sp.]
MILRAVLLAATLAFPVSAQTAPDARLTRTIEAQIDAFRANDFATAFGFASDTIQRIFGSVERFEAMVRKGYPMVWHPAEVRYLEARVIAGQLWQKVMVTDAQGTIHILDYNMIQDENGNWRINAVQLLQTPDVGA